VITVALLWLWLPLDANSEAALPAVSNASHSEGSIALHPLPVIETPIVSRAEIEAPPPAEPVRAGRSQLEVRVVDEHGARLDGTPASIEMKSPEGRSLAVILGTPASYRGLSAGIWQISAKANGYLPVTKRIEIKESGTQRVELCLRATSTLTVRVQARGQPDSSAPADELMALLPLLAVQSEELPGPPGDAGTADQSASVSQPSVVLLEDGRSQVQASIQRASTANTKVSLLLGELVVDSAVAAGSSPEIALEIDLEKDPAQLPRVEFAWQPDAKGASIRLLRAHLEALGGRCVLRAALLDEGRVARFAHCPPGQAKLRALLDGKGWFEYPVEIPAGEAEQRIELP